MAGEEILKILPKSISSITSKLDFNALLEFRISVEKPLIVYTLKKEIIFDYIVNRRDIDEIVLKMKNYSSYAYEEELRNGFITLREGHRVGIFGECIIEDNKIKTMKNITSINIRFSREVIGCSKKIIPYIMENNEVLNTLIIAPPKCGKTTMLRDIARIISTGNKNIGLYGNRVSIIDERSEIAASIKGSSSLNVGIRTDILDNCPKSVGIMIAIRVMSPRYIVCDEIGTYEDMDSIIKATSCGVKIITTIHGDTLDDLTRKNIFKKLIENNVFQRVVVLKNSKTIGNVEKIYKLDLIKNTYVKIY